MNLLVVSSSQHIPQWVGEAASVVDDLTVSGVRWIEEGNARLRACDDFDLVLIDLDTAGLGAADVRRVWSTRPGVNIAVTRWLASEADLVECVKAGALGYFPKELSAAALGAAMRLVAQGMLWCPNLRMGQAPGGDRY